MKLELDPVRLFSREATEAALGVFDEAWLVTYGERSLGYVCRRGPRYRIVAGFLLRSGYMYGDVRLAAACLFRAWRDGPLTPEEWLARFGSGAA